MSGAVAGAAESIMDTVMGSRGRKRKRAVDIDAQLSAAGKSKLQGCTIF